MEKLQPTLESMLRQCFQVSPAPQNQIHKYVDPDKWNRRHPGRELTILSPTQPREVWTRQLRRFATKFANAVRETAAANYNQLGALQAPTDARLFDDTVLDGQDTLFQARGPGRLKSAMQLHTFWTHGHVATQSDLENRSIRYGMVSTLLGYEEIMISHGELQERANLIVTLLSSEQVQPLIYLLQHHPDSRIIDLAPAEIDAKIGRRKDRGGHMPKELTGWKCIVHQALELLLFVVILKCFPEHLVSSQGYQTWAPFVADWDNPADMIDWEKSITGRYIERWPGAKLPQTRQEFSQTAEWCFRVLCSEQMLSDVCRFSSDLEQMITDTFFFFLGFEPWNRIRASRNGRHRRMGNEGVSLWKQLIKEETQESFEPNMHVVGVEEKQKPAKPMDPLRLREAKGKGIINQAENRTGEPGKLEDLESKEGKHGRNKSRKYHRTAR